MKINKKLLFTWIAFHGITDIFLCKFWIPIYFIIMPISIYIPSKLLNIPIQVLWGKNGVVGKQFNSLKIWRKYTNKKVYGAGIKSGHFIPEQNPKETIRHLKSFFTKYV